jgi:putative flippase GtrA
MATAAPAAPAGRPRALLQRLLEPRLRPLRFAIVGGLCGGLQLAIMALASAEGARPFVANLTGFALSAQANFALSQAFTWADRAPEDAPVGTLASRWLVFHACIALTACLNLGVFAAAHEALSPFPAAAVGIAVAAVFNFFLNDRITFRIFHPLGLHRP